MLFSPPTTDQIVALAGVFQACELVARVADTGTCPNGDFETSIHSLFEQNPESTEVVFGGLDKLELGLDALHRVLKSPKKPTNADILKYVLGVLYLQRKLLRNAAMSARIGDGINRAAQQSRHFSETHTNVIANLADLYQQTISTFRYRIQVHGTPEYLQQPAIAARIRCLLFAAIRAAVLWHQVGGRRRHLILNREDLLEGIVALRRRL